MAYQNKRTSKRTSERTSENTEKSYGNFRRKRNTNNHRKRSPRKSRSFNNENSDYGSTERPGGYGQSSHGGNRRRNSNFRRSSNSRNDRFGESGENRNHKRSSNYRSGSRNRRFGESNDNRGFGGGSYSRNSGSGNSRNRRFGGSGNGRNRRGSNNRNKSRRNGQFIHPSKYENEVVIQNLSESEKKYEGSKYVDMDLHPGLLENLRQKGFESATEIQDRAIPLVLEGKDVLGISRTGSGKTGSFLIPMFEKLLNDDSQKLLILAPTRELAHQIAKEAISMIKGLRKYVAVVVGGERVGKQIAQLRRGNEIVIGTPGRVIDLIERGILDLSNTNNIVLDEVDRMLDMGFINDTKQIIDCMAGNKQSLFFSATNNPNVIQVVKELSNNYETIKLSENSPSKSVHQSVVRYGDTTEKMGKLEKILSTNEVTKSIIFVETKRFADQVARSLSGNNFKVNVIHGDKRQNVRERVIKAFKHSRFNHLVATNVAARGIDIDDISHVINFDEPGSYDEYIHRIGRTGRNGRTGVAFTFVRGR